MMTKNGHFRGSAEETLFLELLRTTEMLSRSLAEVLKQADLSPTQYNVLRILRGAGKGLSCGEIGKRMITHDPDITRLLDRLEKRRLVARSRDNEDRRLVLTRITAEGMKLLGALDEPVQTAHHSLLGHLSREKQRQLTELLEVARARIS
jgi:DNA-binding MarR family transcriptional regulator